MNTKTVTILGASGNVGRLLVDYLSQKNYKIKALGRTKPKFDYANVENFACDYNDLAELTKICSGSDEIICMIGLEYKTKVWRDSWPIIAQLLVDLCVDTKARLTFFDNVYALGLVSGKMTEKSPLNPNSKKGEIRKAVDEILLKAYEDKKIQLIIARCPDFYGPNITTSMLGERFWSLVSSKSVYENFGNPDKIHNYTYVQDIAPALEALISSDFEGVINLPANKPITGHEFQKLVEKIADKKLQMTPLRQSMAYWIGFFMPIVGELHEMMYQSENDYDFDSSKILSLFPELKITPYEVGLKESYEASLKKKS